MSDYIMGLRKLVGHRPLLQVGVSVIVENERGEVLLQKRADNHCWGYAGGSVETSTGGFGRLTSGMGLNVLHSGS